MSDNPETPNELQKLAADILSAMTITQLDEHLEPWKAHLATLSQGDASLKLLKERVEVEEYVKSVQATHDSAVEMKARLDAAEADTKGKDEPVAVAPTVTPDAKADLSDPEEPSKDAEQEEDGDADTGETVVPDSVEKVPVAASLNTVDPRNSSPGFQHKPVETDEGQPIRPILMVPTAGATPVQAGMAVDSETGMVHREGYNPNAYQPAELSGVGDAIRQLSGMLGTYHLASVDRLGGLNVPRTKGADQADATNWNSSLIHQAGNPGLYPEPVQAILCGRPTEIDFGVQCTYRTDTPFWDSFGRAIAADACNYRWRRHMTPDEFYDGTAIWTKCKQDMVDPCDESTWKPVTKLPECTDLECTADPFYTTWGLQFESEDEFCRPEIIAEANRLLEAFRAKRLEEVAMYIGDMNSRHLAPIDGAAYGVGLAAMLPIVVAQAIERDDAGGRLSCNETNLTAYIYEYFVKHVALDMAMAGMQGNDALSYIRSVFAICGINNVQVVRDFGCEGQLVDPWAEPGPEMVCKFDCSTVDLVDIDCSKLAWGAGTQELPKLTNHTRIRLLDNSKFAKGTTGVTDYTLRQSRTDARQNRKEYFGEDRHFLFPTTKGDHKILDLTYCVNGQRVNPTAELDCSLFQAPPSFLPVVSPPGEFVQDSCEPGGMAHRKDLSSKEGKAVEAKEGTVNPAAPVDA